MHASKTTWLIPKMEVLRSTSPHIHSYRSVIVMQIYTRFELIYKINILSLNGVIISWFTTVL